MHQEANLDSLVPGLWIPFRPDAATVLRRCLGLRLVSLSYDQFWCDGVPARNLNGELEMLFPGGVIARATITHDHGVTIYPGPLVLQTLEKGRMEWKRVGLTESAPWSSILGARLTGIKVLVKPDIPGPSPAGISGFQFVFQTRGTVGYDNWQGETGHICFNPEGQPWHEHLLFPWMWVEESAC
jgi:hypothetical protein